MEKEIAKALHEWISASAKEFSGDRSEYANGYRRALINFKRAIFAAELNDIEGIRNAGR